MLINTRDFGEVEITEEELLTFPAGVFAFEEIRKFALLSPLGEDVYPQWLQSAEGTSPCFIVFDPGVVCRDYEVVLETPDEKLLKAKSPEKLKLLVLATVPEDFKKTTLNLKSPIVINTENNFAVQVVLTQNYAFKHPLYSEESEEGGE